MVLTLKELVYLGPPFIASTPHFYLGDEKLSQVFKLEPKKERDATVVDIEPVCIFIINLIVHLLYHKRK